MQTDQHKGNEEIHNVKREEWSVKQVVDESANQPPDETLRQFLRGDETVGDADERDIAGASDSIDTPQGREEAKKDNGSNS